MRRRGMIAGLATWGVAAAGARADPRPTAKVRASGLKFPEGPIALADGRLLLCEVARGTLSRIGLDGRVEVVAAVGGGPCGAALGPDGACFVANGGPTRFVEKDGLVRPAGPSPDYRGGSIQRVDLVTGAFTTLYTACEGDRLSAPNDLVFDGSGGFWFTDAGRPNERSRDHGGLYWARADGSQIRRMAYPLTTPNGIALSPDRRRLYVAMSYQRQIVAYDIVGPGALRQEDGRAARTVVASVAGNLIFDSMAVEASGNIVVACLVQGALMVISPAGEVVQTIAMPDRTTTNLAFGGPDLKTAFVAQSLAGQVIAAPWPRPGLKLLYH